MFLLELAGPPVDAVRRVWAGLTFHWFALPVSPVVAAPLSWSPILLAAPWPVADSSAAPKAAVRGMAVCGVAVCGVAVCGVAGNGVILSFSGEVTLTRAVGYDGLSKFTDFALRRADIAAGPRETLRGAVRGYTWAPQRTSKKEESCLRAKV